MIKQLVALTVQADGRYATSEELQFIKDYLGSVDTRIKTYRKIRDNEERIIHRVEAEKRGLNEGLFKLGNSDCTWICQRDMSMVIRCINADMLINDMQRLREGMLVWYETIVRAFAYKRYSVRTYKILQDVMQQHLEPEEAELVMPSLKLTESLLTQ
ncbi:MAG: allophycocyanin [Synechococcaceae cyanobacterium RL_1_2]|nr:allophycocyanin [Synechococcaceae cyanobacterium RL_1_2]